MVINNPHTFYYEIKDSDTGDVAYTLPYSTINAPSADDVDTIAVALAIAVQERWRTLGWKHPDLYYRIGYYSPFPSGMDPDLPFNIHCRVRKVLEK
jgi:hypothetical protein